MAAEPVALPRADEEGQSFGMNPEYVIGRLINSGGFGVIKEARTINNGQEIVRAVKIVRKPQVDGGGRGGVAKVEEDRDSEKAQHALEHEVSVWRWLNHRHILKLHVTFDTEFATFCVMDLNIGGTLFDLLRKSRREAGQNNGRKGLDPKLAKAYAWQLACALRYLHQDMKVCHRDIKLENCLIDTTVIDPETGAGNLRVCDFGLADFLHHDGSIIDDDDEVEEDLEHSITITPGMHDSMHGIPQPTNPTAGSPISHPGRTSSIIGTLEYASPKGLSVNRKLFETAGDIWAYGVIVYALCTGELPFRHPMPSRTAELILRADWDVQALKEAAAGGDAVLELVSGCLEREVELRGTVGDVVGCGWFEGCREAGDGGIDEAVVW
ncbi:hypothetical protein LTR78_000461 [Recurvomyces mirabilis]|uniref:Protein kinase domain-containing protein n=1 Tax=Recurvomyces mirabilis TaxID=574656 RepID=A0AAE0WXX1_9PEZI|nr:hypothetical protein LTR78_000461 [Recurvomyces mirabilis]KAK5162116.1 hypothetical protein LTS14_000462 [Recurvomyces mirabilis]